MLLNLRETRGPLYRRVYLALKTKIRAGGLGPAARVPSTRALARDLGVSRNTVTLAYEQLAAEGYLVSRHRGATSVARVGPPRPALAPARPAAERPAAISAYARRLTARLDLAPSHPPGPRPTLRYDFRYGRPAVDEFPREIWRRLLAAHARRASADALGYGSPAGHAPLRVALSEYLGRARGVVSDPDRIVVVNGTQQALDLLARVLLDPGDGAVVEEPHYPGATIPFEAVGPRIASRPRSIRGPSPTSSPAGSSSGTSAAREPGTRAAGAPSSPPSASGSAIAWRSRERTPACTWWCG
jgi:GntR family transcriptional regulator/MocR family aminotransferase